MESALRASLVIWEQCGANVITPTQGNSIVQHQLKYFNTTDISRAIVDAAVPEYHKPGYAHDKMKRYQHLIDALKEKYRLDEDDIERAIANPILSEEQNLKEAHRQVYNENQY
jgi:hypothetical protein